MSIMRSCPRVAALLATVAFATVVLATGPAAAARPLTGTTHFQSGASAVFIRNSVGHGLAAAFTANLTPNLDLRGEFGHASVRLPYRTISSTSMSGSMILFGRAGRLRPYAAAMAGLIDAAGSSEAAIGAAAGLESAFGPLVLDVGAAYMKADDVGGTTASAGLGGWIAPTILLFLSGSVATAERAYDTSTVTLGLAYRPMPGRPKPGSLVQVNRSNPI
jgi:hypothetical protein